MEYVVTLDTLKTFWSNINFSKDCWVWKGPLTSNNGNGKQYPQIWLKGEDGKCLNKLGGRRLSYFINFGEWPKKGVRTTCGNPLCVSPLHLCIDVGTEVYRKFQSRERRENVLTPSIARKVFKYRGMGKTLAWIADKLEIEANMICMISKLVKYCRDGDLKPKKKKKVIA